MMFMLPHEREQIFRDFNGLINGIESMPVTIHYVEKTGAQDVYGRYASEVPKTIETRCLFAPLSQRADRSREIERKPSADQQYNDAAILLSASIDLDGKKSVWFEVPGIGNFVPDSKPPQGASKHFPVPLEAHKFVREFVCAVER